MFYSERIVASMAEWLVFVFQQIAVCYPCVTNSESGHDSLLFAVKWLSCIAQTLFYIWTYFVKFVSGFVVPECLPCCANVRIYSGFEVRPTDLRVCGQARCQGRSCKSVSFLVSRNANMRRDPCYDQLGLRWYLFKKVVTAFHIFSFKSLTPQAFHCG